MARPTKLSDEVRDRIVQALRAGNYAEAACQSAGISPSTFYRWMERGERDEGIYRAFREAVKRAEADAEVHAVAVLRKAMGGDWRAAVAYLERRHPTRWRRGETRELTGAAGGPIQTAHSLDLSRLSDEDLKLLEGMHDRAAQQD